MLGSLSSLRKSNRSNPTFIACYLQLYYYCVQVGRNLSVHENTSHKLHDLDLDSLISDLSIWHLVDKVSAWKTEGYWINPCPCH